MRPLKWRTVTPWLGALGAIIAAVATAYIELVNSNVITGTRDRKAVALTLIAAVAITAAVSRPIAAILQAQYEKERHRIYVALQGVPRAIHDSTSPKVPVDPIGASLWVMKGFPGYRYLHRVEKVRGNHMPRESHIRWRRGKGVIGRCWAEVSEQVVDTQDLHGAYTTCDKATWEGLDPDTRMGLRYAEFKRIRGKYGTVVAVPLVVRRRFLGVLAVDAPPGYFSQMSSPKALEEVAGAAEVLIGLIATP